MIAQLTLILAFNLLSTDDRNGSASKANGPHIGSALFCWPRLSPAHLPTPNRTTLFPLLSAHFLFPVEHSNGMSRVCHQGSVSAP
jgi:hypothetical protein